MILQALNQYYELLAGSSEIARPGYCTTGVSFALNISADGELLDVISLIHSEPRGNKMFDVPRRMIVPEQVKKTSGIQSNFLCENSVYMLGLTEKGADFGIRRFEAFRDLHVSILEKAECRAARAVTAFVKKYDSLEGKEHPAIMEKIDLLMSGANLVFFFDGIFVQDDPVIQKTWEDYKIGQKADVGQCLVTGEIAPIARLHPSLKGVRGANPTGASLVGFNARAYESYNRQEAQGWNSPVSEKAVFAYTTALNYLLSTDNPNRKITLGDTTVVYWAESRNPGYASAFGMLFDPQFFTEELDDRSSGNKKAEKGLKDVAEKVQQLKGIDLPSLLESLEGENPEFFVLGLAPNAARVSVRFFLRDPFQKVTEQIMKHYEDMRIVKEFDNQPDYLSIRQVLQETVSKKSADQNASPLLGGAVTRSILTGLPYPEALYTSIITRVRVDSDAPGIRKVGYTRAAVIKACLIRKYRNQPQHPFQEVLKMSLNEQSVIPAYVLGRLFAVLEKVQKEAIGDANATIKDRYFTSACATPASVFPVLLRLSQHHVAKAEYGRSSDRRIEELLNLLEIDKTPFPARLSLDDQGIFILGYYHQRNAFFKPGSTDPETKAQ